MEQAIICALFEPRQSDREIELIMVEMNALCKTAGASPLEQIWQRRPLPDRRFLIGTGKVEEVRHCLEEKQVNLVVFFNLLNPIQQRNLEQALQVKIIDRTRLILDIFSLHARSREGKLQVELAQYLYLLPRLTGRGIEMSRLGGGIGTRGPGETRLESDRRAIRKRISLIRRRLEDVQQSREVQRKKRQEAPIPMVSLVGYTSAGKSTLFSTLTADKVLISPQLFSTLDPLMRRLSFHEYGQGYGIILTDTVGFIRNMPEELFTSFQATLEEISRADQILHVVDIADEDHHLHQAEVGRVLDRLGITNDRVLTVYNKADLLCDDPIVQEKNGPIYISAKNRMGIDLLKHKVFELCFKDYASHHLEIDLGVDHIESISRWAVITAKQYIGAKVHLDILCHDREWETYRQGRASE